MATITTDNFLDGMGVNRTAGEAWTMNNGSTLTIRTDTRWHDRAPASMTGSIGATTISATQGGAVLIDARNVRWLEYESGAGNVPAIGTDITQAGVASSYFLGVWADLNSAPTAVGAAMPVTGFIKFREVDGEFAAGALTGIGADAVAADKVGWIEVVQRRAVANTVPRLGSFTTRGDWFELGLTTGIAGQIIQTPTNGGGVGTHVPAIWIETGVGSGTYESYPAMLVADFIPANLGTDARAKFVETMGTGQVRIGNNGTDDVGFVPVANCRILIPNIIGRQSTLALGDANNQVPNSTIADRPDFTTTAAGLIDFEFFINDWYHLFTSPFQVRHVNVATFESLSTSNNAAAIELDNVAIGSYNANPGTLVLTSNFLGGTIKNCKFFRRIAASNSHVCAITTSSDYVFTNNHFGVITYARSTGRAISTSQCLNLKFYDTYQYNAYTQHATSFNVEMYDTDHCDRLMGDTNTTTGMYCVAILTSSNNIMIDGITFGHKGTLAGYHNPYLSPCYSINSSNITFRNLGTRTTPLAVASAALAPIYAAHDAGVNSNLRFQRIYLEFTRTSALLTANTSKDVTFESVHGTVGAVQTLALNANVKGIRATSNSITGGASVYGTHCFDMFTADLTGRLWFAMNEPTTTTDEYVTFTKAGTAGGFTSGGQISMPTIGDVLDVEMSYFALGHTAFCNLLSPVFTGTNPANFNYEYFIDTGTGYSAIKNLMKVKVRSAGGTIGTNTVTVAATNSVMPEVGDLAFTEAGTQIPAGTTVTDVTGNVITLSANFTVSFTGSLYCMRALCDEVISASDGFKLKIKVTTTNAATNNAITYIRLNTATTLAAQTDNLYPLDYATINISGFITGSRVQLYDTTNSVELYNEVVTGTSLSFSAPYTADFTCRVRVMLQSGVTAYIFEEFSDTVTIAGLNRSVTQTLDSVYNTNAIDGSTVTDITIDDTDLLINIDTGVMSWATIYAYETYWLFTEEGIRDEGRFIEAVDPANYKVYDFKLKNVTSPSVPVVLIGGWAVDGVTGKSIDLIDNTGGTLFNAPDHVVAYSTSGGTAPTEAEMYNYFTNGIRPNAFKADVSGLSTFDAITDTVTVGNPNDCKADVSNLATQVSVDLIPTNTLLDSDIRLDTLDADISSRLASVSYAAPDNATITSIWTRVQQLLKLGDFLGLK